MYMQKLYSFDIPFYFVSHNFNVSKYCSCDSNDGTALNVNLGIMRKFLE